MCFALKRLYCILKLLKLIVGGNGCCFHIIKYVKMMCILCELCATQFTANVNGKYCSVNCRTIFFCLNCNEKKNSFI